MQKKETSKCKKIDTPYQQRSHCEQRTMQTEKNASKRAEKNRQDYQKQKFQ